MTGSWATRACPALGPGDAIGVHSSEDAIDGKPRGRAWRNQGIFRIRSPLHVAGAASGGARPLNRRPPPSIKSSTNIPDRHNAGTPAIEFSYKQPITNN